MIREGGSRPLTFFQRVWQTHFAKRFSPDQRSKVVPVKSFPAVCFRHDMDACGPAELSKFVNQDRLLDVPSTCFFLLHQVLECTETLRKLESSGYEIELHSEARPFWGTSVVQLISITENGYRKNLRRQLRRMHGKGFKPLGHAPHSIHNYLGFQSWINWNVIEQASIGIGLPYISAWRSMSCLSEGTVGFPVPLPPYCRKMGSRQVLVLPTSWDDKYFFSSYEDRHIRRTTDSMVTGHTVKEALSSIFIQLDRCKQASVPLVLNLHPVHAVTGRAKVLELKEEVIGLARGQGIPILSLRQLCNELGSHVGEL